MNMQKKFAVIASLAAMLPAAALCSLSVSADTEGWYVENGKKYYMDIFGKNLKGEQEIDGIDYLFAPNGALQTGWQTVGGKRYYYDADGSAVFGWLDWRGERYYIDPEYGKITDPSSIPYENEEDYSYYNPKCAYFDSAGVLAQGWFQKPDDDRLYYADEDGAMASGEILIEGVPYLFSDWSNALMTGLITASDGITRCYDEVTGKPKTGWIERSYASYSYADETGSILTGEQMIGGRPYVFDEYGYMLTGFQTLSDGTTHYYNSEPDGMVTGWLNLDWGSSVYYFDMNGVMATGSQQLIGGRYYSFVSEEEAAAPEQETGTEPDDYWYAPAYPALGRLKTGMLEEDGELHYYIPFGEVGEGYGARATGWLTADGETYHFSAEGTMAVGRQTIDGKIYEFDAEGRMQTGWVTEDGKTCYFRPGSGEALRGRQEIEGKTYFFDSEYVMQTGLITVSGLKYCLAEDGVMQTGVVMLDGKAYLFGDDGAQQFGFAKCGWNSYYTNADGTITKGWFKLDGSKYYIDDEYVLATYWRSVDGSDYYFGEKGAMVTGLTEIDGYMFSFDKNGVYQGGDCTFTKAVFNLVEGAERADEPLREIEIWDNGKEYCMTRQSFPTKLYGSLPRFTLSDEDIAVIEQFAAEHFAPSMTVTEKLWITHQWIHKNVEYAYDYTAEIWSRSYADIIFNSRKGQCIQYNGAMASVLAYFGFDVYMCKGCTKSGNQHFWTEVLIDDKRYYVETGNEGKNGSWQYFFKLVNG